MSNYWHNVRKHQEHRRLLEALEQVPEYLAVSDYAMQLEPYIHTFGMDSIFTATFEELVGSPQRVTQSILEWLNLAPARTELRLEKQNARPDTFTRVRGNGWLDRLARSRFWGGISPAIPRRVKRVGQRLAYRSADAVTDEALDLAIAEVRPRLQDSTRRLESLLGRSFDEWTTTLHEPARTRER